MLSKSGYFCRSVSHVGKRCLFTNVVKQDFILPFKYDFVTDELKVELEKKGVNPDDIDRMYNHQLQNDHEFNNRALPRQNSQLWGYVYGTQLARLQNQLDNLTSEQEFARGYLEANIKELDMRMQRYFPDLDCNNTERVEVSNPTLEAIEARVTADFIAANPDEYIEQSFGNNWFVDSYDDDDRYQDYLPRGLENKLIDYYQYDWDCGNGRVRPQYVEMMQELETGLTAKVDSIKSLLVPSLENLLNSLSKDPSKAGALSDAVAALNGCSSLIPDSRPGKDAPAKLLSIMFGGNSKINDAGAKVLGEIFGCNSAQFVNKSSEDVASTLSTLDPERVATVYKAAQARAALKSEPLTRLLLTVVLNCKPSAFAQFACGTVSVSQFLSDNEGAIGDVTAALLETQKLQKKVGSTVKSVISGVASVLESKGFDKARASATVAEVMNSSANGSPSVASAYYEAQFEEAVSRGDVVGQIDAQVMMEYLETEEGQSRYEVAALDSITKPSSDGLDGAVISGIAHAVNTNSFGFLDNVVEIMKNSGVLNADTLRSAKGDIQSSADEQLSALKASSKELAQAQEKLKSAVLSLKLNYEGGFDFDRIKNTYNPLDVVLHMDNV